jgi:hypothetical protein
MWFTPLNRSESAAGPMHGPLTLFATALSASGWLRPKPRKKPSRPQSSNYAARLKDEQYGPAVLGVELVLLLRQPHGATLQEFGRLGSVELEAASVVRVEVLEPKQSGARPVRSTAEKLALSKCCPLHPESWTFRIGSFVPQPDIRAGSCRATRANRHAILAAPRRGAPRLERRQAPARNPHRKIAGCIGM